MKKQKILILYTSVGLGHKYIAQNINYYLENENYETLMHDVFQLQEGLLVDLGIKVHQFINTKMPWFWKWMYISPIFSFLTLPLRVPLAGGNSKNILKAIEEFQPDLVLSTQTSASAAVAYLKRKKIYNKKFVIAFSDYHFHKYWIYPEADLYLANIIEQKEIMQQLGVSQNKIVVCGITLKPEKEFNKAEVLKKLGLQESNRNILMASGSLGTGLDLGEISTLSGKLLEHDSNIKLIIVTGKNSAMKQKIEAMNRQNILVLGFYEPMQELYQVSQLFITKPGGLSIAETFQAKLPVAITHWLPGQEELNYEYLLQNRLIVPGNMDNKINFLFTTIVGIKESSIPLNIELQDEIIQRNNEGKVLSEAINKVFHSV